MAKSIDARMIQTMFLSGAKNLELNKNWINELNVFPVPDGDTGTNMTLTIMSAANEVHAFADPSMEELAKAISSGSLRGARGNSGVILSQLFRGFTKIIRDQETLDAKILSAAMTKAKETAYKAVMKPKEGTILTVAKAMADKAEELCETEDLGLFFAEIIKEGDYVLSQTPEMLPVLKEAGVVDSGGQGLMMILHGAADAYNGKVLDFDAPVPEEGENAAAAEKKEENKLKYLYCTEYVLKLSKPFPDSEEKKFKEFLAEIGDDVLLTAENGIVKLHVHTNDPGSVLQRGLVYGQMTQVKIENMKEEHSETLFAEAEKEAALKKQIQQPVKPIEAVEFKKNAFISVSIGDGIGTIFRQLGVDVLIEGGQTMNPSTEDILEAIEKAHAENVFILPNNKNIILAANQAKLLTKSCSVYVIPTKTIPQGITALVNYVAEKSPQENEKTMTEEITHVRTGEVTYAVRDTKIDGKEIRSGDIMGIGDEGILAVGSDIKDVTLEMLSNLVDEESELISLYNGADFKADDAKKLEEMIRMKFPDCDVESNFGGQPIYYCVLSVE